MALTEPPPDLVPLLAFERVQSVGLPPRQIGGERVAEAPLLVARMGARGGRLGCDPIGADSRGQYNEHKRGGRASAPARPSSHDRGPSRGARASCLDAGPAAGRSLPAVYAARLSAPCITVGDWEARKRGAERQSVAFEPTCLDALLKFAAVPR